MLRGHRDELAKNLKISPDNLRWFAAFHNESYHPHVHMILYSTVENEGFLTKQGVNNLRSAFAKDIFAQDLLNEHEQQTAHRDDLRSQSKALISDIVGRINSGVYDNPEVEKLLMTLADRLSKTKGKKVYGYLKADVKAIVDKIVDELEKDDRISTLYDLWYQRRENIIKTYTKEMPPREPLSRNSEFKPIRNAVIQSAMDILLERFTEDSQLDEVKGDELPAPDPSDTDIEKDSQPPPITDFERTKRRAESGNKWEQYSLAKEYLNRDSEKYNPSEAVKWFVESAQQGYTVAQYRLGKLFLSGEDVPKNPMYALRWLEEAIAQGNSYAEYLLGRTLLRGEDLEKDLTRAEELLRASADKGNRYAAYTLAIPKQLLPLLREMKKKSKSNLVISGDKPLFVRSYQRSFELLLNKLGIPRHGFHTLRHTFATRAIECGVDVKTLSETLGHKNASITLNRYVHSFMDHKHSMMDKVGKFLRFHKQKTAV